MKKCDIIIKLYAAVVELADAPDSKSGGSDTVTVRPRPAAPCRSKLYIACSDFFNYLFSAAFFENMQPQ